MDVKTVQSEGISIYNIEGEINISTSPQLKKAFEKEISKKIVINFQKVTYIDSSGLATLVEVLKRSRTNGGSLGLSGMTDKVKSLFEITKLDKLFQIYASPEDAVAKAK